MNNNLIRSSLYLLLILSATLLSCNEENKVVDFKINDTLLLSDPMDFVGEPDIYNTKQVLRVRTDNIKIQLVGIDPAKDQVSLRVGDNYSQKLTNNSTAISIGNLDNVLTKLTLTFPENTKGRNTISKYILKESITSASQEDPEIAEAQSSNTTDENKIPDPISTTSTEDPISNATTENPFANENSGNSITHNPDPTPISDPNQGFTSVTNSVETILDSDNDGVIDSKDKCPNEHKGPNGINGCPDNDRDGVIDKNDNCPTKGLRGKVDNNGCPKMSNTDSDNDGILDSNDKCPNKGVRGEVDMNGCPKKDKNKDSDGDGIWDKIDACPNEFGTAANNGCPAKVPPILDTDKDGIPDNEDRCKTEKGTKAYHGCPPPDKDGDGIPDDKDKCPDEKGDGASDGCPEKKPIRLSKKGNLKIVQSGDCASASSDYGKGPFSIKLNIKQRIQLRSISVVSNSNWSANLKLSSSGKQIGSANGESIVDGLTEINLTQLNRYLEPGNYTLTVSGVGQLSNLSTCKSETQSSHVSVMNNNHFFNLDYKY